MPVTEIEHAIYTRATGYAGLSALVSTRVYPLQLPQDPTLPACTYQRISAKRWALAGTDSGVVAARYQLGVWASTYGSVRAVVAQVRDAFQRWRATSGTVTIQDVYLLNELDLFEATKLETEGIWHTALDFEVVYEE